MEEEDGPEESHDVEQQEPEVYEEEPQEEYDDDEDQSRSYRSYDEDDDDEGQSPSYDNEENGEEEYGEDEHHDHDPQFSNGHNKQPVAEPQDEVIELDDHDENDEVEVEYSDDDEEEDDEDEEDEHVEDNLGNNKNQELRDQMLGPWDRASESSDATAERSDDDEAVGDVEPTQQLRPVVDGSRPSKEDNDTRESDGEDSSVDYEERPQEHRDYSSSSDSEGDEGEEEYSDGEDDDHNNDGADQEAIVIGDSESEGNNDEVPVDDMVGHQVRDHYDRNGVEARGRLEDSDNDSDVQGDDSEDSGPHRIAQGVVRDGSDDESEDEYVEPGDDVNRVEEQGSSDEELAEEAAHDVAIHVAVVDEPIEIIDEGSEGDEMEEQPQIVPEAPENEIGRRSLVEYPESSQGDEYRQDDETMGETSMQELVRPSSNVDQARSSGEDDGEQADEDTKVPGIDGALQNDNLESDATDEDEERVVPDEKADTADAAADGEFGDTTDDENDEVTRSRANQLADTDRRADVLLAKSGYASQLEDGYEPEDTHGYTEEEVSEAIHTEDEEEEWAVVKETKHGISEPRPEILESLQESLHHSSDDMDAADERTEHEEDLAAESSELEENAEPKQYTYSPSSQPESGDPTPTTLLQFAQSAQRLHTYGMGQPMDSTPNKAITQRRRHDDEQKVSVEKSVDLSPTASVNIEHANTRKSTSIPEKTEATDDSQLSTEDDQFSRMATTNNFASVEDENEAASTMATESFEMTEDTVDHPNRLDPEAASTKADHDPDIDGHESEAIIDEISTMPSELPQASPTIGASDEMALDPEQEMIQVNAMETDVHPAIEEEMEVDENANKGEDEQMIDAEDEADDVAMESSLAEDIQVVMDITQTDKPMEGSKGADLSMEIPGGEAFEEQSGGGASVASPIRDVERHGITTEAVERDEPRDEVEDAEADEVPDKVDNVEVDDVLIEDPKDNDVLDKVDNVEADDVLIEDPKENDVLDEVEDVETEDLLGDVKPDELPDEVHDAETDDMPDEVHDVNAEELPDEVHDVKADKMPDEVHDVKADNVLDEVDHAEDDDLLKQLGETDPPHGTDRSNEEPDDVPASSRSGKRDKHPSPPSEDVLEDYAPPKITARVTAAAKTVGEADTESISESVVSSRQTRRGTRSRSKKTADGDDQSDVSVDMTAQEKKPIARASTRTRSQAQNYDATDESVESKGPRTRNRGRKTDADEESKTSNTSRTRSRAKKLAGDASADTNNDELSIVSSTGRSSRERVKSGNADPAPTRSTRGRLLKIVADGDDDSLKGHDEQSIPKSSRRSTRGRAKTASASEDDSSVPSTIQSTTDYQVTTEAAFDDDSVIGVSSRRSTRSYKRKEPSTDVELEDVPLETLRKSTRRRTSPATTQDDEEEKETAPTRISTRQHAGKKAGLPPLPPPRRSIRKK